MPWKVGEIARRCGVTVRTLHHYEDIGLVVPWRTPSGHRVYADDHLARLYRVLALRQLGMGLDEIAHVIADEADPRAVLRRQIERLDAAIRQQQALRDRLEAIARQLDRGEPVGGETFLDVMEVMKMIEQYYTPDQLAELARRREAIGDEGMKAAEQAWQSLFADVRAAIDRGVDPTSAEAQALAARWQALIDAFTGGDPGIARSLGTLWQNEGDTLRQSHGIDPEVMAWMGKVRAG
ncbi:MAG: MerR family transcriptional regulator [bacterium]